MKKLLLCFSILILLTGCKKDTNNIIDEFTKSVNKSKSYELKGKMELYSDEESYNYDLEVYYLKDDYYKVRMVNLINNHEQIILKNKEGLYVITPSLNKSFKFESNWPDNSSQGYILSSLVKDIKNDNGVISEKTDDGFIIKSTVNYPNNGDLKYQKLLFDKDYNLKSVEVYSEADIIRIKIDFAKTDLKANLKPDDFDIKEYIKDGQEDESLSEKETFNKIESAIYPLYMPANTFLTSSEIINNEPTSRVILTFNGDKNFVLVEEGANKEVEHEIIPVYGEPIMLNDTIGAVSSNSMYWTYNNIDYYLASNDLTVSEMVFVATSLSNAKPTLAEK